MTEEEVSKLYARLAIQFDAMLATLLAKKDCFWGHTT